MFFVGMLLVNLTAVARDKDNRKRDDCTCSPAMVAGTWGYTETGTVYLPTGAIAYASVGRYTLDANGNLSGARTASAGGTIVKAYIKGTATVNSDCTGTETLNFYSDPDYKNLIGTAVKALVYVDKAREVAKILIPGAVPAVLTTNAKKLFAHCDDEQEK
jgi:hypothetical protein